MQIVTTAEVTPQRIADMMVGAIEGGSGYWCSGVYLKSPGDVAPDDEFKGEIWSPPECSGCGGTGKRKVA